MLVRVTFTTIGPKDVNEWRVCVWGNDDCGMERDFEDEKAAWCCFLEVIGFDYVTRSNLQRLGFVSA
jgi:hypothetical protein